METVHVRDLYNEANTETIGRLSKSLWDEVKSFVEEGVAASSRKKREDIHFLDAGCGTGRYLAHAASLGVRHLAGIDNSQRMISESLSRCPLPQEGTRSLHVADVRNAGKVFAPSSFDMILCTAVIPHIQSEDGRKCTLVNLIRLLKPGGDLLVSAWAKDMITNTRMLDKMERSDAESDNERDYLVTLEGKQWYYYMFTKQEFQFFVMECCRLQGGKGLAVDFFESHDNYFAKISKHTFYREVRDTELCKLKTEK